jgi:superfamily II DNA or RNA helicase
VATLLVEAARGIRVLYAVGYAVLAAKTAQTIAEETGIRVSKDYRSGDVVSTTLQKIYVGLSKDRTATIAALRRFDMLIVDEGHQVPAATFARVCGACPAFYRFALSATPFKRSDNKSAPLLSLFGGLVYKKTEGELAKEGYLPVAVIKMVRFEQAHIFLGRWPAAYEMQVVKHPDRNDLIAEMVGRAKKPCLVLFSAIQHGGVLKSRLDSAGYRCERVDARATTDRRLDVIRRLNRGDIDVVVASRVFNVGIDVPELRSVIIAAAGQSALRGFFSPATRRDRQDALLEK